MLLTVGMVFVIGAGSASLVVVVCCSCVGAAIRVVVAVAVAYPGENASACCCRRMEHDVATKQTTAAENFMARQAKVSEREYRTAPQKAMKSSVMLRADDVVVLSHEEESVFLAED